MIDPTDSQLPLSTKQCGASQRAISSIEAYMPKLSLPARFLDAPLQGREEIFDDAPAPGSDLSGYSQSRGERRRSAAHVNRELPQLNARRENKSEIFILHRIAAHERKPAIASRPTQMRRRPVANSPTPHEATAKLAFARAHALRTPSQSSGARLAPGKCRQGKMRSLALWWARQGSNL